MGTSPTVMVVVTQPKHPLTEAQYNAWYSDNHLPYVLLSDGFPSAGRFRQGHVIKGSMTPYIAFYQANHADPEAAQAAYAAISHQGIGDRWNESPGDSLEIDWWAYYTRIGETGSPDPASPTGAVLVTFAHPDGGRGATGLFLADELEAWYQAFMADLQASPLVRGSTLYRLGLPAGGPTPSRYLSIHELACGDDDLADVHAALIPHMTGGQADHQRSIAAGSPVAIDFWGYYHHIATHLKTTEDELLARCGD